MKYILYQFFELGRQLSKDDINRIKLEINTLAFSLASRDELLLFIQNNQRALCNFKNQHIFYEAADEILNTLEMNFPDYLALDLTISDIKIQELKKDFKEYVELIKALIENQSAKVLEISYPIFSLCNSSLINYHQYHYFKKLFIAISKYMLNENVSAESWVSFLIRVNFNHMKLFNYLINSIIAETSIEDHLQYQYEVLLEYYKMYSQSAIEIQVGYETHLPPITKQLIDWLSIEMRHCKLRLTKKIENQAIIEFKARPKFRTTMSVPQLACVFRSFKDTGIITNEVLQDMLRAINESFETQSAENISIKSLKNNYYDLDDTTKEETKKILAAAAKSIR